VAHHIRKQTTGSVRPIAEHRSPRRQRKAQIRALEKKKSDNTTQSHDRVGDHAVVGSSCSCISPALQERGRNKNPVIKMQFRPGARKREKDHETGKSCWGGENKGRDPEMVLIRALCCKPEQWLSLPVGSYGRGASPEDDAAPSTPQRQLVGKRDRAEGKGAYGWKGRRRRHTKGPPNVPRRDNSGSLGQRYNTYKDEIKIVSVRGREGGLVSAKALRRYRSLRVSIRRPSFCRHTGLGTIPGGGQRRKSNRRNEFLAGAIWRSWGSPLWTRILD